MKIAVFGDSFADVNAEKIWWKYIRTIHGHDVHCFGAGGSSIIWSAKQLLDQHKSFDFNIWCVTASRRITVWHRANYKEISVHVTGPGSEHPDPEVQKKIDITADYILYAMDMVDMEFSSSCIIEKCTNTVPNLLIIPCFGPPIYLYPEPCGFNLYDLYQMENNHYLPGLAQPEIEKRYNDNRHGHLTESTQLKLAEIVSNSLSPGVLQADYRDFVPFDTPFQDVFQRLKS